MKTVGMYEARSKFAELVDQAQSGEIVVVTRNGEPVAELRPIASKVNPEKIVDEILSLQWTLGESLVSTIRAGREERA